MLFRVGQDTFDELVAILAPNPIFVSTGCKPQRHIKYQLVTFLVRYGHRGTDTMEVARQIGIGHGTATKYCQRVCRAIRELRSTYLRWPDEARKEVISGEIEDASGFPNCLGFCDGSLIQFTEEPGQYGHVFRSRKKFFGVRFIGS